MAATVKVSPADRMVELKRLKMKLVGSDSKRSLGALIRRYESYRSFSVEALTTALNTVAVSKVKVQQDQETILAYIEALIDGKPAEVPAKALKKVAPVAPKRPAPVPTNAREAARGIDRSISMMVNASRVTMETARNMAENSTEPHSAATLEIFQSIISAQTELRRMLDGEK